MKRALALCVSLCGLGFAPACAADSAPVAASLDADPALFRISDDDTVIYLFGTIHMLDEGRTWFDDGVKTAFDASDELVVEAVTPTDPAVLGSVMAKGFDIGGTPLRQEMPAEAAATADAGDRGLARAGRAGRHHGAMAGRYQPVCPGL